MRLLFILAFVFVTVRCAQHSDNPSVDLSTSSDPTPAALPGPAPVLAPVPVAPGDVKPPTELAVENVGAMNIELSWQDNANDEIGFKLERGTAAAGPFAEIAKLPANAQAYNDTGLAKGTQYFYRVRAFRADANSQYSNAVNAKTKGKDNEN